MIVSVAPASVATADIGMGVPSSPGVTVTESMTGATLVMVTVRLWLTLPPSSSVTVTSTTYCPSSPNAWSAWVPVAVPPSPKSQA